MENRHSSWKCGQCDMQFCSRIGRRVHVSAVHAASLQQHTQSTKGRGPRSYYGRGIFSCAECDFQTTWQTSLMRHEKQHLSARPRRWACEVCPKAFFRSDSMQIHMATVHKRLFGAACRACNQRFDSRDQKQQHRCLYFDVFK
jgi:hypothetical protein